MSEFAVYSFERLLATGASVAQVDEFLLGLRSDGELRGAAESLVNFLPQGHLRDQIPFLLNLYKDGFFTEARPQSRVAFVFLNGILAPNAFAMVRARLCAANASCIYLYDDRLLNYGLGVRQLGANARESDDALRTALGQFNPERVFTVGFSAGGYAAIKCALSLNAYGTVAFSPFTTFLERDYINDGRGRAMVERTRKVAPESLVDLVPLLKQREPALKLVSFFGGAMAQDVWHSKRLNGVKDACAIAIDGETSHDVLSLLIARGVFDSLFQNLSEGESVENSVKFALRPTRVITASKRVAASRRRLLGTPAFIPPKPPLRG